jgi:DNA-binding PadR family transcriptional regulator
LTPVFRHGRLRLYLLKLLDEAPRHGYEVIRLLQDRFLGVYSPSPGTIYPRLARLEAEGLVTRDEADGKKVYRITEKGRQELRSRIDDLSDLEDELSASARGIAMEIGRDVRDTVRSLREELGRTARSAGSQPTGPGHGPWGGGTWAGASSWTDPSRWASAGGRAGFRAPAPPSSEPDSGAPAGQGAPVGPAAPGQAHAGSSTSRPGAAGPGASGPSPAGPGAAGPGASGRGAAGPRAAGAGASTAGSAGEASGHPGRPSIPWTDLERLATDFAREILAAARARSGLDESGLRDLRGILSDALARIRTEVFGPPGQSGAAGQAADDDRPPTA